MLSYDPVVVLCRPFVLSCIGGASRAPAAWPETRRTASRLHRRGSTRICCLRTALRYSDLSLLGSVQGVTLVARFVTGDAQTRTPACPQGRLFA